MELKVGRAGKARNDRASLAGKLCSYAQDSMTSILTIFQFTIADLESVCAWLSSVEVHSLSAQVRVIVQKALQSWMMRRSVSWYAMR